MQRNLAGELQVNRNSSYEIKAVSAEAVTVPAGAAGTVVVAQLANFPVRNAAGNDIGGAGDTSLALTGGSVPFTNEVAYGTPDAILSNGDFWVDYIRAQIRGKKATTATSATAAYKIAIQNISLDEAEVTVNVDGTDLASGAKQDTGNGSLSNIDTSASEISAGVGATTDSAATAGGVGSISAKLRLMTTQLAALVTGIITTSVEATATHSNVNSSATVVDLVAANAAREGLAVFNDSTSAMNLKLGSAASATSCTVEIAAGGYWEMPIFNNKVYRGAVTAIWDSTNGAARVTEFT